MRQAGVLAAACLVALDDFHGGLLGIDHSNAVLLAERLVKIEGCFVDLATVQTNIVFLEVLDGVDTTALASHLREKHNVVVMAARNGARDASTVRLMMHRGIKQSDIEFIVAAVAESIEKLRCGGYPTSGSCEDF